MIDGKFPDITPASKKITLFFIISAVVFLAFLPSLFCDFTNFDDDWMLTNNDLVRQLAPEHIVRNIFGRIYYGVYQPTVFLTYAIEYFFAGLTPLIYHLDNVLLHILNTLLVFTLINLLSRNQTAALIASLFWSLSPLRVESVTWVTERKDLLYSFFYILSLIKYAQYIQSGNKKIHLILSLLFFVLSCLSKLTAVSLSFIIVLLDYYHHRKATVKVLSEKALYFGISLLFGVLSIMAVRINEGGKMPTSYLYSGIDRLQLSSYAWVNYLAKSLVPYHLSAFHPYMFRPGQLPGYYQLYLFLAIITVIAGFWLVFIYRNRKITFGVLFFLAAVIFALQLIPVGDAAFADRNIYISNIGTAFLIGEFFLFALKKYNPRIVMVFSIAVLLAFGAATHIHTHVWKNSISLFTNVIEKYPEHYLGYLNRGVAKYNNRDFMGAMDDYDNSLKKRPNYSKTILNRALIWEQLNEPDSAIRGYNEAIKISPRHAKAYLARANLFFKTKRFPESKTDFTNAMMAERNNYYMLSMALTGRARAEIELNEPDSAMADLYQALSIIPDNDVSWFLLGKVHTLKNDRNKAREFFMKAIKINPANDKALYELGMCEIDDNKTNEACEYFRLAAKHSSEEGRNKYLFYCSDSLTKNNLFHPNGIMKFRFANALNEKKDTVYYLCHYDSSGNVVQSGIIDVKTKKYHGESKWFYPDSSLKKTGYLRDTIPIGVWKEFYPDGKIKEEYSFSNGQLSGNYRFYYPSGMLQTERFYNNGRLKNIFFCRDAKGNPMNYGSFSGGSGSVKIFDENGKMVQERVYKEGIQVENAVVLQRNR